MNNPPAFPSDNVFHEGSGEVHSGPTGMSLLDYFAVKAMHGIMSNQDAHSYGKTPGEAYAKLARSAYDIAAAMLSERAKRLNQ